MFPRPGYLSFISSRAGEAIQTPEQEVPCGPTRRWPHADRRLLDTRPQPCPPARRGGRLIWQRPVVCDLLQELSDKGGAESLTAPASGFYVPHQ